MAKKAETLTEPTANAMLTLPFAPEATIPENAVVARHIAFRMTIKQANGLHRAFRALHERHMKTSDGKHVDTHTDAMRWVLERMDDAAMPSVK